MAKRTRRDFLTKFVLASMSLAILPYCKKPDSPDPEPNPDPEADYDILVIGAGIAGLAAAKKLQLAGYSVKILEANNRHGGRIMTVDMDGYKADHGASWIHGITGNPLYDLANENAINTVPTYYEPSYLFDIDGTEITWAQWEIVEDKLNELYDLAYDYPDSSLQFLLDEMEPGLNLSNKMKRIFYGAIRSEIEIPYAVDADDISARALTTNDSFPGDDVVFTNGMQRLTDIIATGLDIQYDTFVSKISYADSKVSVFHKANNEVNSGRACNSCHSNLDAPAIETEEKLIANKVVVALPLGMLKYENVSFTPALPADKLSAINSLGIGTMNKVFLKFSNNFWNTDGYFFQYENEDHSKIIEFFSPTPTGTSNIIVAVFAGQHARSLEYMQDSDIITIVMDNLKGMFGNNIPDPIEIQRTAWHTNALALGSYPHLAPGADLTACDIIATPIDDKVFFAGDATNSNYMATAHGAYLSGIRAADEIIG